MVSLNYLFEDMFDKFAEPFISGAKKFAGVEAGKSAEEPGIVKNLVTGQVTKGINRGLDQFGKRPDISMLKYAARANTPK